MLCCSHLEIHNDFWTSTPRFHFALGPTDFEASPAFCSSGTKRMPLAHCFHSWLNTFQEFLISLMTTSKLLCDIQGPPMSCLIPASLMGFHGLWLYSLHRILLTSLHLASSCMSFKTHLIPFRMPFLDPWAWALGFSSAPVALGYMPP